MDVLGVRRSWLRAFIICAVCAFTIAPLPALAEETAGETAVFVAADGAASDASPACESAIAASEGSEAAGSVEAGAAEAAGLSSAEADKSDGGALQVCSTDQGTTDDTNGTGETNTTDGATDADGATDSGETTKFKKPSVLYSVRMTGESWRKRVRNGSVAGKKKAYRLGYLSVKLSSPSLEGSIRYSVHIRGEGWWKVRRDGKTAGSLKKAKLVNGLRIGLEGEIAKKYDVWYRTYVQGIGWMGWTKNWKRSGTTKLARRIEAVRIKLVAKGATAPKPTQNAFTNKAAKRKMIIIGDSRTMGIYFSLGGDIPIEMFRTNSFGATWCARIGAGYYWMNRTALNKVDSVVDKDSAVGILLGVNDAYLGTGLTTNYADRINEMAAKWTKRGARVYYVAVGPVGYGKGKGAYVDEYGVTDNKKVRAWNRQMKKKLSPNVLYLDAYSELLPYYGCLDNIHYDVPTSLAWFNYLKKNLL